MMNVKSDIVQPPILIITDLSCAKCHKFPDSKHL